MASVTAMAQQDSVVISANQSYDANQFKKFIYGKHYRKVWSAPVKVRVLNLDTAKGGLEPLEKGGGQQTTSLKLKGANGRLYALRSIKKDPSKALPPVLRNTIAEDVIYDQVSAAHPYGAFILPPLAAAIDIYHTNPELVYIPDDPKLGDFRDEFSDMMAMLEEDADENWENKASFGFTENAVSTETVLENMQEDNDYRIDQQMFLRARLFDMWIGDWDRHSGQWRWAEFEEDDVTIFRPIPEDRDNVFFKFDGFLPWLISRSWGIRRFQDFGYEVDNVIGLNYNARHLDRRFLTEPDLSDWQQAVRHLQQNLTDSLIESAVSQWPDTIFSLTGRDIIDRLIARRDDLMNAAITYYSILSQFVNVIGSDENEYFDIEYQDRGRTLVTVYKADEDGERERKIYQRLFDDQTFEIRLYGRDSKDYFHFSGNGKNKHLVRVIGGESPDEITIAAETKGKGRIKIYDQEISKDSETGDAKLRVGPEINVDYRMDEFDYDLISPNGSLGYTFDDGLILGAGFVMKTNGFKYHPFRSRHSLLFKYATGSNAFALEYDAQFLPSFGGIGADLRLRIRAPNFNSNFFGFGNESIIESENPEYYQIRFNEVDFFPGITISRGLNKWFKLGPNFQYFHLRNSSGEIINLPQNQMDNGSLDPRYFGGLKMQMMISTTERQFLPEQGIRIEAEGGWYRSIGGDNNNFSRLKGALTAYHTIDLPLKTTFAVRLGGGTIFNDYYFFQAMTLGDFTSITNEGNIRGFRRDRFSGRTVTFGNFDLRMRWFDWTNKLLPMEVGSLIFTDAGRVFYTGETSGTWHQSYGGGIYLKPLGKLILVGSVAISKEETFLNFNTRFMF